MLDDPFGDLVGRLFQAIAYHAGPLLADLDFDATLILQCIFDVTAQTLVLDLAWVELLLIEAQQDCCVAVGIGDTRVDDDAERHRAEDEPAIGRPPEEGPPQRREEEHKRGRQHQRTLPTEDGVLDDGALCFLL